MNSRSVSCVLFSLRSTFCLLLLMSLATLSGCRVVSRVRIFDRDDERRVLARKNTLQACGEERRYLIESAVKGMRRLSYDATSAIMYFSPRGDSAILPAALEAEGQLLARIDEIRSNSLPITACLLDVAQVLGTPNASRDSSLPTAICYNPYRASPGQDVFVGLERPVLKEGLEILRGSMGQELKSLAEVLSRTQQDFEFARVEVQRRTIISTPNQDFSQFTRDREQMYRLGSYTELFSRTFAVLLRLKDAIHPAVTPNDAIFSQINRELHTTAHDWERIEKQGWIKSLRFVTQRGTP